MTQSETVARLQLRGERSPERYLPDWASYAVSYVAPLTYPPAPVPWLGGAIPEGTLQAFGGTDARRDAERFAFALALEIPPLCSREAGFVAVFALAKRVGSRRPLRVTWSSDDAFCYLAIDGGGREVKNQSRDIERYGYGYPQEGWLGPSEIEILRAVRDAGNRDGCAHSIARTKARADRAAWDRAESLAERGLITLVKERPASRKRTATPDELVARRAYYITVPGETALRARGIA